MMHAHTLNFPNMTEGSAHIRWISSVVFVLIMVSDPVFQLGVKGAHLPSEGLSWGTNTEIILPL